MSILTRQDGTFVPVREQRTVTNTLAALNAECVLPVNGDESALIQLTTAAAVTATISFEGSIDGGANYFPIVALPYAATTGTLPSLAQVMISEAFSAVQPYRVYAVATAGLTNVRVRASAWTSGNLTIRINSDPSFSIHPVMYSRCSTLAVTNTGAAGAAVTATVPAVVGLRHYIDRIEVTRSSSVALTAGAAPTVVTTTNIPGNPAFTFGADASPQGADKTVVFDAGSTGLAATAINTNTTVVCPVTTGVIWRVNVIYRLGL